MEGTFLVKSRFSSKGSEAIMEPKILLTMVLMSAIQLVAYFGGRAKSQPQDTKGDLRTG